MRQRKTTGGQMGNQNARTHGFYSKSVRREDRKKLRAAADPTCRRSKRLQDLADAQGLIEATPVLLEDLTAAERTVLEQLPR